MSGVRKGLCVFYGLIALVGLVATWSQNLAYFGGDGPGGAGAFWQFVLDTRVNPASRSITADIGLFLLAAAGFMVSEARKLGVRLVWIYVVLGFVAAISVTFPLFMIAREMRLAKATTLDTGVRLTVSDIAGLVAVTVLTLGLVWFVLS